MSAAKIGGYAKALTTEDIAAIENACAPVMQAFGYVPDGSQQKYPAANSDSISTQRIWAMFGLNHRCTARLACLEHFNRVGDFRCHRCGVGVGMKPHQNGV